MTVTQSWRAVEPPLFVAPPYDRTPVEVMLANGIVVEAVYWWDDRAAVDAGGGWMLTRNFDVLPYPPVRWRPLGA